MLQQSVTAVDKQQIQKLGVNSSQRSHAHT